MQRVGVYEAKARLSELLQKVEAGQEITITNHGQPVARLVPARERSHEQLQILVDRTKRLRRTFKLGRVSVRRIIEDGRR